MFTKIWNNFSKGYPALGVPDVSYIFGSCTRFVLIYLEFERSLRLLERGQGGLTRR